MKTCQKCREAKPTSEFSKNKTKHDGLQTVCKDCWKIYYRTYIAKTEGKKAWRQRSMLTKIRRWQNATPLERNALMEKNKLQRRRRRLRLRDQILDAYGHACACCGETTREFLAIDHVNNDGHKDRREDSSDIRRFQKIIADGFPDRFQLLCHNCHHAKTFYKYKTCPCKRKTQNSASSHGMCGSAS